MPPPPPPPAPDPVPPPPPPPPSYPDPVPPPSGYVITPSGQQPKRSANDTAEYRANYLSKEYVNALFALDNGWTGAGVVVGVIDDGVEVTHPELAGQISSLSKDFGSNVRTNLDGTVTSTKRDVLGDEMSEHGTAVAGIIAAKRNDVGGSGITPDAKIAVLRVTDHNLSTSRETFPITNSVAAIDYARTSGITILNRSLGINGFSKELSDAVTAYGKSGGIVINSAGNDGEATPGDAPNVTDANRNAWIFVGNLVPDGTSFTLADRSNRAGAMADRYLVAPGSNVTTTIDGGSTTFEGTGSAAAMVAGSVALIRHKWPQLTGVQAGEVLLQTARDLGAAGTDPVFGRGLLDVRAALTPIDPKLSNGSKQTALASSMMHVPEAIGSNAAAEALSDVTILDRFGRDFTGSLSGAVLTKIESHHLGERLAYMMQGRTTAVGVTNLNAQFGFTMARRRDDGGSANTNLDYALVSAKYRGFGLRVGVNSSAASDDDSLGLAPTADVVQTYAAQARNSLSLDTALGDGAVALSASSGGRNGSSADALALGYDSGGAAVRVSVIREKGAVFGARSFGALELGSGARTLALDGKHRLNLGSKWSITGYASVGYTRLKRSERSVVASTTGLIGTRLGLTAEGPVLGGLINVGIAQPLTIENGSATFRLGDAYDLSSGLLTFRDQRVGLAADQRRLQLTAGFARSWDGSSLRVGFGQDMTRSDSQALLNYALAF